MSGEVITRLEQVEAGWLTAVLLRSGALMRGEVAGFEAETGRGNWSANVRLRLRYSPGALGELPERLFLKMVDTDLGDGESFDDSEVRYYRRDYLGVAGAPLVRCYDGAYSAERRRYHLLLEDLSGTHIERGGESRRLSSTAWRWRKGWPRCTPAGGVRSGWRKRARRSTRPGSSAALWKLPRPG